MLEHPAGPAYRAWLANGGTKSREMDPMEAVDAAWECSHGRLAHDAWRDAACDCWTANPSRTPDLMGVLANAEQEARNMPVMTSDAVVELARERGTIKRGDVISHFEVPDVRASHILAKLAVEGRLNATGATSARAYTVPNDEPEPDPPAAAAEHIFGPVSLPLPDPIAAAMHQIENLIFADEAEIIRLRANITRLQAAHGVLDELLPEPVLAAVA